MRRPPLTVLSALTRLGFDSKAVVTGDVTQIDLPIDKRSGLVEVMEILRDVEGIGFMRFTQADVVRHPLVQSIIRAYESFESARREGPRPRDEVSEPEPSPGG